MVAQARGQTSAQSWGSQVLGARGKDIPQGMVDSTRVHRAVSRSFPGSVLFPMGFQETLSQCIPRQ